MRLTSAIDEVDDGLGAERAAELFNRGREDDQVLVQVLVILGQGQRRIVRRLEGQLVATL